MKTMLKNYSIMLALFAAVLLLVANIGVTYAEEAINIPTLINLEENGFFQLLHDINQRYDCHIKVSQTDELLIAVVCYGPETPDEYTIDTIVYNKLQLKALWIDGNADITAGVLKTVENIGIETPEQYVHEDVLLGFDAFKILRLGEEIDWR